MVALQKTGHVISWGGLFKTVAGGLKFSRGARLAVLMSLPNAFNILLDATFCAHKHLAIGLPDVAACAFPFYCYPDWYRPLFARPASTATTELAGGECAL